MEFTLRPWALSDLDSLVTLASNPHIARFMSDQFPHPYTEESGRTFIEFANTNVPPYILAIDVAGKAVGGIGLHPQSGISRMNAELGYWLGEPYWGKGIMTRAIRLIAEYGFRNYNINRIYARPFGTNLASQRALEKAGFRLEARLEKTIIKNGELLDEMIYALRK